MIVAEFIISNMNVWVSDIAQKYLTTVRIVDCIPWSDKGGQAIFEVMEPQGKAPFIIKDIQEHPDITSIDMNEPEGGRLRGTVGMRSCVLIRSIMSAGCFLESAAADGDGNVKFRVAMGSDGSLPQLFRKLEGMGLIVQLQSLTRLNEREPVTKKQEEVLQIALERGYFDCPRRIKSAELAKLCGVSPTALKEVLARAQRNVLRKYFEGRE